MADDNNGMAAARRQRIQMLKRCILLTAVTLILLPLVLCFILLERVQNMDRTLDKLIAQVEALTNIVSVQEESLDRLTESTVTTDTGSVVTGGAGHRLEGKELIPPQDGAEGEENGTQADGLPQGKAGEENGVQADDLPQEADGGENAVQTEESGGAKEITAAHKVYLTFDDGPSKYTEEILDILDQYDVKATFFVVGKDSDSARRSMQDIVDRGHTLGMHSYSHKYSEIYKSPEDFAADYEKIWNYVYETTGVESTVYRFPGGSSNSVSRIDMEEFADYLDTRGVRFFDWNISSGDGGSRLLSVETLVENCTADIERFGTSVILMHDAASKPTTVEALPEIIEKILALDDTVILPITEDTELVQHIQRREEVSGDQ